MSKKIEAAIEDGIIEDKIAKLEVHKKAIEEKIAECKEALEKSKKPKLAVPFVPKHGEKYYYDFCGDVLYSCNDGWKDDEDLIRAGNSFRTKEETKLASEKRFAEVELLRMCDGLDLKEKSHFVPYFVEEKGWEVNSWYNYKVCPYRFASEESCKAAIDKLGDRKLRLVFNIPVED